jgi:2-keto-4-pentenoate hydratase/2-oxohepta-3-ene-1,7-dioic acid hydratase in catechol pathway
MRLISYHHKGEPGVGVMTDGSRFVALGEAAPELPRTLKQLLGLRDGLERARRAASGRPADLDMNDVSLDPVIPDPYVTWALALNFKRHIEETRLTTSTKYPHLFIRHPGSVVGHLQPLICPPPDLERAYDYEGELAVVIGRGGRHIPVDKAKDHIAGYACYNEGSTRNFQSHNRQFGLGKNFEKSGSFGPWLMTPDEVGDIYQKELITRLNGKERQRTKLDDLLFSVEKTIAYISNGHLLRPGDVIVMGTPGQLPPAPGDRESDPANQFGPIKVKGAVHMKPGDRVEVEITGIGILVNTVIADEPLAYRPS